jgi:hypothetical protein
VGGLLGVGIALQVVNVETQREIARSIDFDGAAKVEIAAPPAFLGRGIVGNQGLVIVDEAVAQIEEQSPALQSWA